MERLGINEIERRAREDPLSLEMGSEYRNSLAFESWIDELRGNRGDGTRQPTQARRLSWWRRLFRRPRPLFA